MSQKFVGNVRKEKKQSSYICLVREKYDRGLHSINIGIFRKIPRIRLKIMYSTGCVEYLTKWIQVDLKNQHLH